MYTFTLEDNEIKKNEKKKKNFFNFSLGITKNFFLPPAFVAQAAVPLAEPESFLTTRLVESIFNTVPKVDVMLAFNSAKRVLQSATHTDSSQRAEGTRLYSGTSFAAVCAGNCAENFSMTVW